MGEYESVYLAKYCISSDNKKLLFKDLAYLHEYAVRDDDSLCAQLDEVKVANKHLLSADVLSGFATGDFFSKGNSFKTGTVGLKFLTKTYLSAILRAKLEKLVGD